VVSQLSCSLAARGFDRLGVGFPSDTGNTARGVQRPVRHLAHNTGSAQICLAQALDGLGRAVPHRGHFYLTLLLWVTSARQTRVDRVPDSGRFVYSRRLLSFWAAPPNVAAV
jgi:hypothetical protein